MYATQISIITFLNLYCVQPETSDCKACRLRTAYGCQHPLHPMAASTSVDTPLQTFLRTTCTGMAWESCYRDADESPNCQHARYDGCGHPEHPRNKQTFADIADVFQTAD